MIIKTGYYTIEPYQNLLHITSYASWDERAVTEYINETISLITSLYKDKPWAALHDATNWTISTPKAEQMLAHFIAHETTGNITHHAIVTGQTALNKWQADNLIRDVKNYTCKNFEYIKDAMNWLNANGYSMTHPA